MKRTGLIIATIALLAMGLTWIVMAEPEVRIDPVCQMTVNDAQAITYQYNGQTYYFCSEHCKQLFSANPAQYITSRTPAAVSESSTSKTAGMGCGMSSKRAGCGGCPAASSCFSSAGSFSGSEMIAQKSSVQEVNEFLAAFHPVYLAAQKGNAQEARNFSAELIQKSENLDNYNPPSDVKTKDFKKARKALQKSVKDLAKLCKKGNDEKVLMQVNIVHDRYMELRSLIP
jgi:YHS domain-containing protein